jgi:TolB-like protein
LLLENAGVPVSKDALIEAGWGGLAVADNNLTVQIAALRRVLGDAANADGWIETLPRRGYRYVGPAVATNGPDASSVARTASPPTLPDRPSIAVLPFSNLSGDPQQDYFADGMVDDIITGLARINWLFVIARNSTFVYKGRAVDVKEVGRELGVRYVLEGSVRKAGGSVRVTGQMIDASTGAHVWAGRYDRSSNDPTYALAHGNAAMCHHCLFLRAGLQEVNRTASIRHARSAIIHGQDDALALTWAGFSIGMDGHDRGAAFTALEAALAISPSSALTYILGSVILGWGGEAERAIEWSERGIRLSPFDSWSWAAFDAQAMSYLLRGRYGEACRAAYKSVQANPAHSITYVQLAAALAKLGRLDEARAAAARVLELHPTFRYSRQFAGVNCAPALAEALGDALRAAGLPE